MPAEVTTTHVQKGSPHYSASFAAKAKIETIGIGDDLRLNPEYFKTIPGILKIVQLVIAIVCMCCVSPPLTWFSRLFTFVVAVSFAITLILCFCILVTLRNVVFPTFNWIFGELIYTAIVTVSLLITAIIHLTLSCRADYRISLEYFNNYFGVNFFGTYIAAGVFGLLNFLAYGAGAYFLYLEWKMSRTGNGNGNGNAVSPANGHA